MTSLLRAVALGLALTAIAHAAPYPFKASLDETHPIQPGGAVSVANVSGGVTVRTWDQPEVRITAEKSARTGEELKQIELAIDASARGVHIRVTLPRRSGWWWFTGSPIRAAVQFTLWVPRTASVDAGTVNGDVVIEGVTGKTYAHTINGRVRASGPLGAAKLSTVSGAITAAPTLLPPNARLDLQCINGSITVTLPANVSATLDAATVNGAVHCGLPIRATERNLRHVSGTIGAGGAEIRASTVNGSVHIRASAPPAASAKA